MRSPIARPALLLLLGPLLAPQAVARGAARPPVWTQLLPAVPRLVATVRLPVRLPALDPDPPAARLGFAPLVVRSGPSGYRLAWIPGQARLTPWRHRSPVKSLPRDGAIIIAGAAAQPGPAATYLGLALGVRLDPLPGQAVSLGRGLTGAEHLGRRRCWVRFRRGADIYAVGVPRGPGAVREAIRLAASMVRVRAATGHRYRFVRLLGRGRDLEELTATVVLTPAASGPRRWDGFRHRTRETRRRISLRERWRIPIPPPARIGATLYLRGRLTPAPPEGLTVRARLLARGLATRRFTSLGGDPSPGWSFAPALPAAEAGVDARGVFRLRLAIPAGYRSRTRGAVTAWRALRPGAGRVALTLVGPGGSLSTHTLAVRLLAPAAPSARAWTLEPALTWGPALPVALPAFLPWELVPARGLRVPFAPTVTLRPGRGGMLLMVAPARARLFPYADRSVLAAEATLVVADGRVGLGLHPLSVPRPMILSGRSVTVSRSDSAVLVTLTLPGALPCRILVRSAHPLAMARTVVGALRLFTLGMPASVVDLVEGYWQLLSRGHLASAYAAWMPGGAFRRAVPYGRFARGFAGTASLSVRVGAPHGLTVPVVIRSRLRNGTLQRFSGTMTGAWQSGTGRLRLVSASIAPCSGACPMPPG